MAARIAMMEMTTTNSIKEKTAMDHGTTSISAHRNGTDPSVISAHPAVDLDANVRVVRRPSASSILYH